MAAPKKTHCNKGHVIAVVGRYPDGKCRECDRQRYRRYYYRNHEMVLAKCRENKRLDRELMRSLRA